MRHGLVWLISIAILALAGCTESVTRHDNPRILLMGDSMMSVHGMTGASVSHAVEKRLREPVVDRSVAGARFLYKLPISGAAGMNITKQYRAGNWDWVILNGGGNDILFGCGCGLCGHKIDRLISEDGRKGVIPGFISKLRQDGAQVLFVGYMRTPGVTSPIEHCVDEGREMDARLARLAELDRGVHFLSLEGLVPNGDRSFHALDLIHPSAKGSDAIGARIVTEIKR
ncbi:SGNH/GDSL hydrolase family protein [Roseovarius aestuariivivens]|uniref:SGNH/GDSL hydrolase family protein n=1 Tax=Roseovarius aestuariivivens TaxID=1888910 RepID=UPI00315A28AE